MDPPAEIPKKKLKLTEVDDVGIDKLLKDQDDDVLSIESSNLGEDRRILCQLCSEEGETIGDPVDLPIALKSDQLQLIANAFINKSKDDGEDVDSVPYAFFVENDVAITSSLADAIGACPDIDTEKAVKITVQPQAYFKVQAVTRCTSSLPGHAEAVISVGFSPDGTQLASGSGDTTVRLWDLTTEMPLYTCEGHKNWVLAVAWSPDGSRLSSADKNGQIIVWDPKSGKSVHKPLTGHKKWVTYLSWEPLHVRAPSRHFVSASKDNDVRVWDAVLGKCDMTLSGHTAAVTCVRWGGQGLIYSSSQDRTIKVWRASDGVLCRTLAGHAHWVNTLALSTDYALRTGAFDPADKTKQHAVEGLEADDLKNLALKRYQTLTSSSSSSSSSSECVERLMSGSDDFTLFLWSPEKESKPIARLTGHMQLVNDVKFSPDGRRIASASFDKSIKLWDGRTGKYLASLRGHVGAVYQISWSSDSRLIVSGSADSTLKVWDVGKTKILGDLPGHADEVYAVDWSPDGSRVASGGKDKVLKMWRK